MNRKLSIALIGGLALAACDQQPQRTQTNEPRIKVRSAEQDRLHTLDAFNLAIGLKRAIYDAGYACRQVTDGGFVGAYENLDMWMATCTDGRQTRDWAIFAGPDGSAQVRDCKDVPGTGLPDCKITRRPKGSFNEVG